MARRSGPVYILIIWLLMYMLPIARVTAQASHRQVIHLKGGDIVLPPANARTWDSLAPYAAAGEPVQVLLSFATLPTEEQKKQLAQNGIQLLDYIPDNTYTAIVNDVSAVSRTTSVPGYSIIRVKPEWKADKYLWRKAAGKGSLRVLVSFSPGVNNKQIGDLFSAVGGRREKSPTEAQRLYKVTIGADKLKVLAEWYGVLYISPLTDMVPLDLQSRPAVKGNVAIASPINGGYGLTGDSVTVGVGDNSSGIYHADLKDRIVNFNPAPAQVHGEHVNGIVGSAANVDPFAGTIAPHVQLVDYFFDMVLSATGVMYRDYNMTLTNNSYSVIAADCDYSGTYDGYSYFIDTMAFQYPEVLHVFASGNDGWMNCPPYLPGFSTVAGGYQPAKNNVVVGSMTDYQVQAADEGRGPTRDGRLKPDVVGVGLGAYSTVGVDMYAWDAGTSMASPQVVSGLAALTQQYKRKNGGTQPKADVLKGILLNGAMDLGNPGPDYTYGFGAMDVSRSLKIIDDSHFATNTIGNGAQQTITVTVPANTAQLKIMLSWSDVPASPTAAKQLVNDLDLLVTEPGGATHNPLVPDPIPTHVNDVAVEKEDHLNNVEQVTITNPAAGTYTVRVSGYNVPSGPQRYVVTYDVIPTGIQLTHPLAGEQLYNTDSIRVYWDAVSDGHTFKVEFSPDNGGFWVTVATNVPANVRYFPFVPAGINSGNCLLRVTRNGTSEVVTSGRFVANDQPVVRLSSNQCPGYMNIHWSPVPGASAYILQRKIGFYMQPVDTVTDTVYSFGGLPLTEKSYVAVQPVLNGQPGLRSVAAIAIPNSGNCLDPSSTGDIMVEQVISPASGRKFTSTEINASTVMQVKLRNLYTAVVNTYTLSYSVNGGIWQTFVDPAIMPANGTVIVPVPGVPFGTPGVYNITVAVHNNQAPDPQPGNDTVTVTIRNMANAPVDLTIAYQDGFEDMPKFEVRHDSVCVSPNEHWDYANDNDSGRMRSFVNDDITITGNRSVSLDEWLSVKEGSHNAFTGTFNLSGYDTATAEVRVDFDYALSGTPKSPDGNIVYARGNDGATWVPLYNYDLSAYPGGVTHVLSRSLTDAVLLAGNNFSASTQVSFRQNDTSLIAARDYGNGMTIDNFRMYTVANDAELVSIVSPLLTNCGLPSSVPLTVKVRNGVNYTLHNIGIFYKLDSGPVLAGMIDSVTAKDTVLFTFSQLMSIAPGSSHTLDVWLAAPGDTYTRNDSISNYFFRNSLIISVYPYLQNFEASDGGYYAAGINNTWQYGTPAAVKINTAASGTKAWKTNLTGRYRNLERSYLYSPCFDLSSLQYPMLSFSAAMDIENCGNTLCDAGYVEYSYDGSTWNKLGSYGLGTNWYDSAFNVWNETGFTRWHVASIYLPQPPVGGSIRFRFVLATDPGATFEGMAVDDIHIFDRLRSMSDAQGVKTAEQDLAANTWTDFLNNNELLSSVKPPSSMSQVAVTLYAHDTLSNPSATQYTFPRSYTVKAPQNPTDSISVRLFMTDSDVVKVVDDTTCPSCTEVSDAYRLGITQYSNGNNTNAENGTLADDTGGVFSFTPYRGVQWVPYDNGYYAEFKVKSFSEFWFNNGGPTGNFPAGVDYLNFMAFKAGTKAQTYWYSLIDTAVHRYVLERSDDNATFNSILDTAAVHANPGQYAYTDPEDMAPGSIRYYRLKWAMTGSGKIYYSPVRKVSDADSATNLVQLDARMINSSDVLVSWRSFIDGIVDHYILERAINTGGYVIIRNQTSLKHYGQQYSYVDMPGDDIPSGTPIHYKLTAVLTDGSSVVVPVRTITWINTNAVVTIFPNPTFDGNFTINWFADPGTVMDMHMSNAVGQTFYEATATARKWSNTTTFLTPLKAKGVYFIRMGVQGKQYIAKLVYE
jgi:hypothetical protein